MKEATIADCIIGRFAFKKTKNNNLIGEFSNIKTDIISTESADIVKNINPNENIDFCGIYETTWQENGKPHLLKLHISCKTKNSLGMVIYKLEWKNKKGSDVYIGEAFVFDDILVGDYRNFKIK